MSDIRPIFKYVSKFEIKIVDENTGQELGQIFSPADTIVGKESAIQVCGFDYACQLWGCGVYGYADNKGNYHAKKDIQLLWVNKNIIPGTSQEDFNVHILQKDGINNCAKCYSKPCKCDELKIYQSGEPMLDKL